jgi:hypothetical protein
MVPSLSRLVYFSFGLNQADGEWRRYDSGGPSAPPAGYHFLSQELTIRIDKGKIKMVIISLDLTLRALRLKLNHSPGRKSEA